MLFWQYYCYFNSMATTNITFISIFRAPLSLSMTHQDSDAERRIS
jgi:hypothetical protein